MNCILHALVALSDGLEEMQLAGIYIWKYKNNHTFSMQGYVGQVWEREYLSTENSDISVV